MTRRSLSEVYKAAARAMHEVDCGCSDWVPGDDEDHRYDEMATAAVDAVAPLIAAVEPDHWHSLRWGIGIDLEGLTRDKAIEIHDAATRVAYDLCAKAHVQVQTRLDPLGIGRRMAPVEVEKRP